MDISFLTPVAALAALAGLLPLLALLAARRRSLLAASVLGLPPSPRREGVVGLLLVVVAVALLGLAVAQPVLVKTEPGRVRGDVEAMFVVDTSRSMQASAGADNPLRIDQAKAAATRLRSAIADVPAGVASFTDRVLPHLLPTPEQAAFAQTLAGSIGVEQPPPREVNVRASTLSALGDLAAGYFSAEVDRRLLVVVTDGESRTYDEEQVVPELEEIRGLELLVVEVGDAGDRIYTEVGGREAAYRPDASAPRRLRELVEGLGGSVFGAGEVGAAGERLRALAGIGPSVSVGERTSTTPLGRYAAIASLVPLAALLARRLWPRTGSRRRPESARIPGGPRVRTR